MRMVSVLILATLAAEPPVLSGRFTDGGFRAEESVTGSNDARTFAEMARLTVNQKLPEDRRINAAQRAFDAFARYSGPVNVQFPFPRCHCGRTFDQIRQWDYRRPTEAAKSNDLTRQDLLDFKAACYAMLKSPDPQTRQRA